MTLHLAPGAAAKVAAAHRDGANAIGVTSTSAPAAVDAGMFTPVVLDILAACAVTAGDVALVTATLGHLVDDVAKNLATTDDQIGDAFARVLRGVP